MPHRRLLAFTLLLLLSALPASATCGGGGGGGTGGVVPNVGSEPMVYRVSWKVLSPGAERPQAPLAVYWFPTSPDDARSSPLQTSRSLSLAGSRCVAMALVPVDNQALHEAFKAPIGESLVVVGAVLRRHFYEYERFDAVRAMEMQEARDDYMFSSLHQDPAFIELTKLAVRHKM